MQNEKLIIYFTAELYGESVGLSVSLGEFKPGHEVPYSELIKNVKPEKLAMLLPYAIDPKSIKIITPEEYERDYGDDDNAK